MAYQEQALRRRRTRPSQSTLPQPADYLAVASAAPTPRSELPAHVSHKIRLALVSSIAPSTARKYKYSVAAYLKFCDNLRIEPSQRFPASEELLCAFAASRIGEVSESTVRNALSAIKAVHTRYGLHWSGGSRLNLVVRGVTNLAPATSAKPDRPGVSAKMLELLAIHLDVQDPRDAAVLAAANTAFWALTRLGELIPDSKATPLSHLPTRGDLRPVSRSGLSRVIHLPYTKTKRGKGEDVTLTNQSGLANPLPILESHLRINRPSPVDPLFSFREDQSCRRLILSKKAFLQRCNQVWQAHGFPQIKGHSFRIGGTSELLLAGVHPDVVRKMGRWSSDHFLRYWRGNQGINEKHVVNVLSSMRS